MVISFIRGYYTVIVEGLGTESFLNYLIRNKIYVYNVNRIEKTKIQFDIDRNNFKKLKSRQAFLLLQEEYILIEVWLFVPLFL